MRAVSDEELDAALNDWETQGFALLAGVGEPGEMAALRARAEALIAGTIPDPGLFFQPDAPSGRYEDLSFGQGYAGPDVAYRKIEKLERDPLFWDWLSAPIFGRIAARLHRSGTTLYRAALFQKAAHLGSDLPFHQDGGRFWGLDRDPCFQAWTALDDASEAAGCLWFVPGTHKAGLASPLGGLVPAELAAGITGVAVPARAGDVVLLHNLVWHRSGPNRTDSVRRGLSVSYLDASTRCTRKKHAPRVFPAVF